MMSLNREESILPWYMPYLFCAVKRYTRLRYHVVILCIGFVNSWSIYTWKVSPTISSEYPPFRSFDKTKFCRTKPSTHIFFFFLWQNNHCKFHVVVVVVERDADENGSWIKEKKEEKIFLDTFKIFATSLDLLTSCTRSWGCHWGGVRIRPVRVAEEIDCSLDTRTWCLVEMYGESWYLLAVSYQNTVQLNVLPISTSFGAKFSFFSFGSFHSHNFWDLIIFISIWRRTHKKLWHKVTN